MSRTILHIENLTAVAQMEGGHVHPIVDNVSLSLREGEILGLIGESGAGKSTIGLAAMGFSRRGCAFVGGRVLLGQTDLLGLAPERLRAVRGHRVAYVPQSAAAALNPAHTLLDQVAEGPVRHGLLSRSAARARAIELFASLDLPDPETFGLRYPHQVSGGQLQRAATAMAMSCRPDILILDEPTTALDVTTQIEVLVSVRRMIQDHGTAGLYISHDLSVVAQMASRILVLRHGRAVETGSTEDILTHPREDYTRRLVAARTPTSRPHQGLDNGLLTVDGLKVRYRGGQLVLNDVSVSVKRAETVAVVGESGSGKSSLARAISGLLQPEQGSVSINGKPWPSRNEDRSRDQLRRIQLIFQSPDIALNPHQTILEIVGRPIALYFGGSARKVRGRVEHLLQQVDLPVHFVTRRPGELSGGQKQRVAIARALAAEPDLMICDEVTSALDPLVADEILKLLVRLQAETGIAYLFITHDINIVRRIADRVLVMRAGCVIDEGPQTRIFAEPFHPYTRQLLEAAPEMRQGWLDERLKRSAAAVEK